MKIRPISIMIVEYFSEISIEFIELKLSCSLKLNGKWEIV